MPDQNGYKYSPEEAAAIFEQLFQRPPQLEVQQDLPEHGRGFFNAMARGFTDPFWQDLEQPADVTLGERFGDAMGRMSQVPVGYAAGGRRFLLNPALRAMGRSEAPKLRQLVSGLLGRMRGTPQATAQAAEVLPAAAEGASTALARRPAIPMPGRVPQSGLLPQEEARMAFRAQGAPIDVGNDLRIPIESAQAGARYPHVPRGFNPEVPGPARGSMPRKQWADNPAFPMEIGSPTSSRAVEQLMDQIQRRIDPAAPPTTWYGAAPGQEEGFLQQLQRFMKAWGQ